MERLEMLHLLFPQFSHFSHSMASFLKTPFFLGFLLLLASSPPIDARLSTFFGVNDDVSPPEIAPSVAPSPFLSPASPPELAPFFAPEPEPSFDESQNAYGLYGHRSAEFSPEKQTKTTNDNDEEYYDANEDYSPGESSFESGYENTNLYGRSYENSESYNNGGYKNTYEKNESEIESEGMSVARFMENGNFFYDVGSENQNGEYNGYESTESSKMQSFNGGNEYPNEYNSMEEFENQENHRNQEYAP